MGDFYKPEVYGPFASVPLDRNLCYLQGRYVLCPSVVMGDKPTCKTFTCGLEKGWQESMRGIMDSSRPIKHIPKRCERCLDADLKIQLIPLFTGTNDDASDQETPEDPESASSEEPTDPGTE